ncbi:MAG: TIM barrel protein [Candidatus Solibacter usitatus]|nr:TIM barrel protein [Candidatus Solibacter usitatus]
MQRRQFLSAAAVSAAMTASARTLSTVGAQLYTVRSVLPEKPLETLQAIEEIGFKEVEVVGGSLPAIWPHLQQTKLKAVSVHLDTGLFLRTPEKLPAAIEDAAKRGFRFAVCPYIAPQDRGGVEVIKRLADSLNKAGEKCNAAGLTLAYHNHAFEFEPAGSGTLLDVLMQNADAKLVQLELDIMWVKVAGVEPVSVIEKYGKRVALMHLKNVKAGIPSRYNEGIPRDGFAELDKGVIDMAPVLAAAAKAGVKHYFIEQDQTPGNPLDSLRQSFAHISKLNY